MYFGIWCLSLLLEDLNWPINSWDWKRLVSQWICRICLDRSDDNIGRSSNYYDIFTYMLFDNQIKKKTLFFSYMNLKQTFKKQEKDKEKIAWSAS